MTRARDFSVSHDCISISMGLYLICTQVVKECKNVYTNNYRHSVCIYAYTDLVYLHMFKSVVCRQWLVECVPVLVKCIHGLSNTLLNSSS